MASLEFTSCIDPCLCLSITTGNYQRLEPEPKDASVQLGPVVFKERFELPLSGGHVGLLLGSGGNFIKQLCSKHKVSVHLGEESKEGPKKRGHTYLSGDTIKVTVSHVPEEKADVEGFKEELMRRATAVNESRKKHTSNVSQCFILFQHLR